MNDIKELIGKTAVAILNSSEEIIFAMDNGDKYRMYHEQDCCESVTVEDICGDLQDLVGTPFIVAEERTSRGNSDDGYDSCTWTYYEFVTIKGAVTIRWYGTSNGYYSELVSFVKIEA